MELRCIVFAFGPRRNARSPPQTLLRAIGARRQPLPLTAESMQVSH
jgi:hypothetical protein